MATRGRLDFEALVSELRVVCRKGVRVTELLQRPALLDLNAVRERAEGSQPIDLALALEGLLKEAIAAIGSGPLGRAAAALFGTSPMTRGLLLKQRRRFAAAELGVAHETLRRWREEEVLREVAVEFYRISTSVGRA